MHAHLGNGPELRFAQLKLSCFIHNTGTQCLSLIYDHLLNQINETMQTRIWVYEYPLGPTGTGFTLYCSRIRVFAC